MILDPICIENKNLIPRNYFDDRYRIYLIGGNVGKNNPVHFPMRGDIPCNGNCDLSDVTIKGNINIFERVISEILCAYLEKELRREGPGIFNLNIGDRFGIFSWDRRASHRKENNEKNSDGKNRFHSLLLKNKPRSACVTERPRVNLLPCNAYVVSIIKKAEKVK